MNGYEAKEWRRYRNAAMYKIKGRVHRMEAAEQHATKKEPATVYTYSEDDGEDIAMFQFNGKPEQKICALLKSNGFKWSPTRRAWVQMLNNRAALAVERVIAGLEKERFESIYEKL